MAQRFRHTEMMELESPTESKHGLTTQEDHTPPSANNSNGKRRFTNIPHLGIIMAIASSFFFSLSSLIVKLVPDVHPVALATYRFAGILLPSIPIVIRRSFPKRQTLAPTSASISRHHEFDESILRSAAHATGRRFRNHFQCARICGHLCPHLPQSIYRLFFFF